LAVSGVRNARIDIGFFTIRQRRTDPAWMGRAFAVSKGFNFIGYPIGTTIAGALAPVSLEAAIVVGAVGCIVAGVAAAVMIPRRAPSVRSPRGPRPAAETTSSPDGADLVRTGSDPASKRGMASSSSGAGPLSATPADPTAGE